MALRILWSQKEDPLDMQYCTLEGNNTLAERVRGEIFSSFKRSFMKSFQLILSCVFV